MTENSWASGPLSAAISFRSAPTEKNWRLPAMIRGQGCFFILSFRSSFRWLTAAVSASTQAWVRRLVPSGEMRRRMHTGPSDSIRKKGEVTETSYARLAWGQPPSAVRRGEAPLRFGCMDESDQTLASCARPDSRGGGPYARLKRLARSAVSRAHG